MSRKPDPERICDSRRSAIVSRLRGTGMNLDRAEARVVESRRRRPATAHGRVLGRGGGRDRDASAVVRGTPSQPGRCLQARPGYVS